MLLWRCGSADERPDGPIAEAKPDIYARLGAPPEAMVHINLNQPPIRRIVARVDEVAGYGWRPFTAAALRHPVEANAVFADLGETAYAGLRAAGWSVYRVFDGSTRFMCSWATSEAAVDELAEGAFDPFGDRATRAGVDRSPESRWWAVDSFLTTDTSERKRFRADLRTQILTIRS